MFGFLRFCFLCCLAIAAGVAAVSIPVAGKTPAEHVRGFVQKAAGISAILSSGATPPAPAPVAKQAVRPEPPAPALARKPDGRPPADSHTREERAALDELIGRKAK